MILFPQFTAPAAQTQELPLYRDVLMDYEAGRPVWESGNPVLVTGLEAVKGWAWRAVDTARYRYPSFSWSYGCELEALVGSPIRPRPSAARRSGMSGRRCWYLPTSGRSGPGMCVLRAACCIWRWRSCLLYTSDAADEL